MRKYRIDVEDQAVQNLLRDTTAWLNAASPPHPTPTLHVQAVLAPALSTILQNLADPTASHGFRALLSGLATLRDDNIKLEDKVDDLQSKVIGLETVANDQEAKILAYELAKLHCHYYLEVPSRGGGRTQRKKGDHGSKESAADKRNWEAISDELSSIKRRLEDNEISPDDAEKERAAVRAACRGLPVDIMWDIASSRPAVAHRKTRTIEQQKQLLREASKYSWPETWPKEWLEVTKKMREELLAHQPKFHRV